MSAQIAATEIGFRLAESGREILRRSQQAETAIREWKDGQVGEIRIGVGPMLAATLMGDFFSRMVLAPPNYGIKIVCEYAARLVERLHQGLRKVRCLDARMYLVDALTHSLTGRWE